MDEANKIIQELNDKIAALEAENYDLKEKNHDLGYALGRAQDEAESVKSLYAEKKRCIEHRCDVLQAQVDIVKLIFG